MFSLLCCYLDVKKWSQSFDQVESCPEGLQGDFAQVKNICLAFEQRFDDGSVAKRCVLTNPNKETFRQFQLPSVGNLHFQKPVGGMKYKLQQVSEFPKLFQVRLV